MQVQRDRQQSMAAGSSATNVVDGEAQHGLHAKEQGKVFQHNVAVMLDFLREEVALPCAILTL